MGCRRERPLRGIEARLGRPLPTPARHGRQSARSAVPPRSVQPIFVELVLELIHRELEGKSFPSKGQRAAAWLDACFLTTKFPRFARDHNFTRLAVGTSPRPEGL